MKVLRLNLATTVAHRGLMAVGGIAVALAIAGCGSSNNSKKGAATPPPGATPLAAASQKATPLPAKPVLKAPALTIDPNKGYTADIKTDKGDIIVELNAKAAPLTVNNFVFLARQHFYDSLTCHRVIPGFVAQCGDPKGDGSGGPGYMIADERSGLLHDTGAIAMAKAGPNTAGSQFYITLAPQKALDGNYTVFGHVVSGQDVVGQLTPRDPSASPPPATPGDRIVSVTITESSVAPAQGVAPASATPSR